MDHQSAPTDRAALIRRLESARARLTTGMGELRQDLDVGSRLQSALGGRPLRLIGIATGAGLLVGLLRRGKKRRGKGESNALPVASGVASGVAAAGLMPVLLKFLFPLLKPAIAALIARSVARR